MSSPAAIISRSDRNGIQAHYTFWLLPLLLRRVRTGAARGLGTPSAAVGLLLMATATFVPPSEGREEERAIAAEQENTYAITPKRKALLNTIRYAEGTWKQGKEGYRTLYGGGRFQSLEKHPEVVVVKRYTSAAAGAYQFLPGTWHEAASKLQLESFQPDNQDQAALYLVERRGVLKQIDSNGLTAESMAVLAHEWASFPKLNGKSAYGQPVKKAVDLERFYKSNLETLVAQS